jgi:hypothetical protein
MIRHLPLLSCLSLCLALLSPAGQTGEHAAWNELLADWVSPTTEGHNTRVDYAAARNQREALKRYLDSLAAVDPQTYADWPADRRLAFLINAYNAWTVELILRQEPGLDSIRDIGGWLQSPWDIPLAHLLGRERSLDDIEHRMIRGPRGFGEPRIHFAVNCASVGCPALRREAYTAEDLEAQLEAQTRQFLSDRSRNGWRDDTLYLSPLFKWYREDFESDWRGTGSLEAFLLRYADALGSNAGQREALRRGSVRIRYTDYDWALNRTPGRDAGKSPESRRDGTTRP